VDGDRVAVGEVIVLGGVEGHPAAVVEAHDEAVGRDAFERAEGAVPDPDAALVGAREVAHREAVVVVSEEHQAIAGGVLGAGARRRSRSSARSMP